MLLPNQPVIPRSQQIDLIFILKLIHHDNKIVTFAIPLQNLILPDTSQSKKLNLVLANMNYASNV